MGQVGQCLQLLAPKFPQYAFLFTDSTDLDITDRGAVNRFFNTHRPSWVLNCAAYTAVDKAESEKETAFLVNARGPAHLARACAAHAANMLHLSTDYVYHTRQNTPFVESDPVQPKSVYAKTKLQGDRAVLKALPEGGAVIRTSWVYAPHGNNFVRTMLRLGRERELLRVVYDQVGSPTYAPDLAEAMMHLMQMTDSGAVSPHQLSGIWHYSNEGVTSWYDFAKAVFEMAGIACKVEPITTAQYPTPAPRPPFSVLNKQRIKETFELAIPHWRESLLKCLQQLEAAAVSLG